MKFLETLNEWTIFRLPGFYLARERGQFWFRILDGYGLALKDWSRRRPYFSERKRHPRLRVGNWRVTFLRP